MANRSSILLSPSHHILQSMNAAVVLQIQELCDYIAHFLDGSCTDLKSCALVSPRLSSAAQRWLFRDVTLLRGCASIDSPYPHHQRNSDGEAAACRRFCSVLAASPHLLPFVRRLRVTFSHEAAVKQLSVVKFPNLAEVVFDRGLGACATQASLTAMADIIRLPSIRRVGLLQPTFQKLRDFSRLFAACTPHFESLYIHSLEVHSHPRDAVLIPARPVITQLHLGSHRGDVLQGALSIFDFSKLEELRCNIEFLCSHDAELLGPSLTRLKINSSSAVSPYCPPLLALKRLSGLKTLEIQVMCRAVADIDMVLARLPQLTRLELVTLEILHPELLDPRTRLLKLRHLGTAVAGTTLPPRARIQILLPVLTCHNPLRVEIQQQILATFAVFATNRQAEVILI
ncbi:hypothetical protein B0H17DRAFT_1199219 [Mycena rosella]|uniref:Uncharacterized protein n=1 Tax=Mycena rosella TaxID=1033263 RepID=A0AAD7GGW0_MYCRO|nr:hypothetical protein B0H17DRAFT_1199219 [Mycena rosella]